MVRAQLLHGDVFSSKVCLAPWHSRQEKTKTGLLRQTVGLQGQLIAIILQSLDVVKVPLIAHGQTWTRLRLSPIISVDDERRRWQQIMAFGRRDGMGWQNDDIEKSSTFIVKRHHALTKSKRVRNERRQREKGTVCRLLRSCHSFLRYWELEAFETWQSAKTALRFSFVRGRLEEASSLSGLQSSLKTPHPSCLGY